MCVCVRVHVFCKCVSVCMHVFEYECTFVSDRVCVCRFMSVYDYDCVHACI